MVPIEIKRKTRENVGPFQKKTGDLVARTWKRLRYSRTFTSVFASTVFQPHLLGLRRQRQGLGK